MKNLSFLLGFLCITINGTYGQSGAKNFEVKISEEIKESNRFSFSDIVGYDETGFYALSIKDVGRFSLNSTFKLSHFSKNVKLTNEAETELKENKKPMSFEFIVQMDEILYVFSSQEDKKAYTNNLYVQTINKSTLELNNDRRIISEIDYQTNFKYDRGSFDYGLSRDSSKIIIYYNLPYEKKEYEKFGFHILDAGMNEIWSNAIVLPYTDELFVIQDYRLDNFGHVHVLGKKYHEKLKSTRKGEVNYHHLILSYYKGEDKPKEYDVKLEDKYLNEMRIEVNDDKEIICAGFYSNIGVLHIDGSFYLKIDNETKEIVVKNFKEFSLDFITQNLSDKQESKARKKEAKGKDVELFNYNIDDMVMSDDGSIFLIGEQYYEIERSSTDADGNTVYNTYYFYKDIIVVNIDFIGNIVWAEKIGKYQKTRNDGGYYSSYTISVTGDKLYFAFNDHPDNLVVNPKDKDFNKFQGQKNSIVVLVEIDNEGNQKRKSLLSTKDVGVMVRPKVCEQISENELIIFGIKGRKRRFAKVTFSE